MDKAYRTYRFVLSRQDALVAAVVRCVLAASVLFPAAFLIMLAFLAVVSGISTLVLGSDTWPEGAIPNHVLLRVTLVILAVLTWWAASTDDISRTAARSVWAFCTGGFLLPLFGILGAIFGPPDPPDAFFPKTFVVIVSFVFGVPLGFLCLAIAKSVAPKGSPEKALRYVLRPIGGGWAVLAVGLLLTAAIVLHIAGWEGLLN